MTTEKKILVGSDLHTGSLMGLMRERERVENILTGEANIIKPNKGQRYLLRKWQTLARKVGTVDAFILNGDLCDGIQRKSQGMHLWSTDLGAQVESAVELIKMVKAKKYIGTMGSGYHTGENAPTDQVVVEQLPNGEYHPDFLLDIAREEGWEDCKFRAHFAHYTTTTKSVWMYATTAIARNMLMLKLNDSIAKYGKVNLTVRSHQHWLVGSYFSHSHGFITGAWQLRTPFAVKNALITPPEIGCSMIYVEPSGKFTVDHDDVETPADSVCPIVRV